MKKKVAIKKVIPFDFVLEQLEPLDVHTKPMFGCTAIYEGHRLLLILRDRPDYPEANGVWLATSIEHHESLRPEFPSMTDLTILGKPPTHWQVLPATSEDFEESALRACELCLARDPRIGKIPKTRKTSKNTKASPSRTKSGSTKTKSGAAKTKAKTKPKTTTRKKLKKR